jgi:hypothetical protein
MQWAALGGHSEVVKLLLSHGALVNTVDSEGRQPLHAAAIAGHADVVKTLIDRHAKLDVKDNEDHTPLSWGLERSSGDVVRLLRSYLPETFQGEQVPAARSVETGQWMPPPGMAQLNVPGGGMVFPPPNGMGIPPTLVKHGAVPPGANPATALGGHHVPNWRSPEKVTSDGGEIDPDGVTHRTDL